MRFLIDSVSFNTQPPKGGWKTLIQAESSLLVSTHSRLKAAGRQLRPAWRRIYSFNTQPPKGGWEAYQAVKSDLEFVSTHSRLKAAGSRFTGTNSDLNGFNTQPPKGGWVCPQPKSFNIWGFNTQPPKGGWTQRPDLTPGGSFQHTAA